MSRERKIDVSRSNYSVIDNEFGNMRERFENEMRRVEEEMNRLCREFDGYTPSHAPKPSSDVRSSSYHREETRPSSDGRSSSYHREETRPSSDGRNSSYHREESRRYETSTTQGPPPPSDRFSSALRKSDMMAVRPTYDPYFENLKSPLIRDESDGKTLRLRFDVAQYKPEEVTVKTVDNRLLVHAKHEESGPNRSVFREYNQEFLLPRGTNPEFISSTLSTDGVLTVEAPLPQLAIQH